MPRRYYYSAPGTKKSCKKIKNLYILSRYRQEHTMFTDLLKVKKRDEKKVKSCIKKKIRKKENEGNRWCTIAAFIFFRCKNKLLLVRRPSVLERKRDISKKSILYKSRILDELRSLKKYCRILLIF
jgi:hypothetical protein